MATPETPYLPFNQIAIRDQYRHGTPDADRPELPGHWLILRGPDLLTRLRGEAPELPFGPLPVMAPFELPPVFIGTWQGQPLRAARLPADAPTPEGLTALPAGFRQTCLNDQLLSLAGLARQVLHWRSRSRICPACGGAPAGIPGTFGARCTACGREYFPRLHPAIIVAVRRGDAFLFVRKPNWPTGQYGLVAGFVEFAESLEECVIREVKEETGITVTNPRYRHSQNWPFPSQLMAGFEAEYASGEIVVDTRELEDAAWFTAAQMPPGLSPRNSIARYLIDTCVLGLPA